jgi:DNA-binding CsgD family transcriptional regulator
MRHVDEGLAQSTAPEIRASLLANAAHILTFRGETDRARATAADAAHVISGSTAAGRHAQVAVVTADAALVAGSAIDALDAVLEALSDRDPSDDEVDLLNLTTLGFLALRAARPLLQGDRIQDAERALNDQIRSIDHSSGAPVSDDRLRAAWLATCRSAMLTSNGKSTAAEWLTSASHWKNLSVPLWVVRCLIESAEADARLHRGRAQKSLSEALEIAHRLGSPPLIHEAKALARRANLRVETSPAPKQVPLPANLTTREHEVLILVSSGATNRMIGRSLFISERTAGVHVSNVLRKLNAKNRGEAAAIGHRLNLLTV